MRLGFCADERLSHKKGRDSEKKENGAKCVGICRWLFLVCQKKETERQDFRTGSQNRIKLRRICTHESEQRYLQA